MLNLCIEKFSFVVLNTEDVNHLQQEGVRVISSEELGFPPGRKIIVSLVDNTQEFLKTIKHLIPPDTKLKDLVNS